MFEFFNYNTKCFESFVGYIEIVIIKFEDSLDGHDLKNFEIICKEKTEGNEH